MARDVKLYELVDLNRDVIISRTRNRVRCRPWPSVAPGEVEHGVPLFLTQLSETLRLEGTSAPFPPRRHRCGRHAPRRGSAAIRLYGVAGRPSLWGYLPDGSRRSRSSKVRPSELGDNLNTTMLAFHTLKRGAVAINGSTGAVLGRSFMSLREVVDRTLSEVRLEAGQQRRARLPVVAFIDEIVATRMLHAGYRDIRFTVEPVDPALSIDADPQFLASAVMNLVHNAFKNTPSGRHVVLRARADEGRLLIETEDECGRIPSSKGDLFQVFGDRRGSDRSGLGLGLSIARKAVRAHGGKIHIRDMPGKGCVFVIVVPLAAKESLPQAVVQP